MPRLFSWQDFRFLHRCLQEEDLLHGSQKNVDPAVIAAANDDAPALCIERGVEKHSRLEPVDVKGDFPHRGGACQCV